MCYACAGQHRAVDHGAVISPVNDRALLGRTPSIPGFAPGGIDDDELDGVDEDLQGLHHYRFERIGDFIKSSLRLGAHRCLTTSPITKPSSHANNTAIIVRQIFILV